MLSLSLTWLSVKLFTGHFLSDGLSYLNLAFLAELPIGVLFLNNVFMSMTTGLFLGLYGILSRFCSSNNLAPRLAVFDSIFTITGKDME